MTAGPPADGPALSQWWERAAHFRPAALWTGTLDLVHIEAPVRVLQPAAPLDPLHRLLLRAVEAAGPADLARLDARLGLGPAVLHRWLGELSAAGLIHAGGQYALSPAGAAALESGRASWPVAERRQFTFVVNADGSAHFLPWAGAPGPIVRPVAVERNWLMDCIARPAAWKRRVGFPETVAGLEIDTDTPGPAAWRRLAVARGERPAVVLILTADTPARLIGFTVRGDVLDTSAPALRLDAGWEEPFPELHADPATLTAAARLHRA